MLLTGDMYYCLAGERMFHGTISFQEAFNLYREYFSGRLLLIVSDCCYSGHWVEACAETLGSLPVDTRPGRVGY